MQATVHRAASSRAHLALRRSKPARALALLSFATAEKMEAQIKGTIANDKVVVYSKTYCPYCSNAKALFQKLNVPATVVELDDLPDSDMWQVTLQAITGMRTVPQVFVGGKLVGGCDDTMAAYQSGKLKEMLAAVGVSI